MLSIILLVHLFHSLGLAAPFPVRDFATTSQHFERDLPTCECPSEQRTVWGILWSCLATVFTCTWVSVHPNIPDPDDSVWKVTRRRVGLMIWAILAPELIVLWAIRQWIGARQYADMFHEFGWTKTHGYFLQMGGFMLYKLDGKSRDHVLKGRDLERLFTQGKIMFPTITEEEIQDRSKGDGLAKAIAVFQTTWFVVQRIARHVQGLVVTELEIITLAFATLNGMMYFFWWNKPLAVRYSVPVFLLQEPQGQRALKKENKPKGSFLDRTSKFIHQMSLACRESCTESINALMHREFQWSWRAMLKSPLELLFDRVYKLLGGRTKGSRSRVGTHHDDVNHMNSYSYQLAFFVAAIGGLFGAIHCIAWSSPFPSDIEHTLWRVCSLILISMPEFAFLIFVVLQFHLSYYVPAPLRAVMEALLLCLSVIGLPLYAMARLTLIVEAFIALRALTPAALADVEWASFVPHI